MSAHYRHVQWNTVEWRQRSVAGEIRRRWLKEEEFIQKSWSKCASLAWRHRGMQWTIHKIMRFFQNIHHNHFSLDIARNSGRIWSGYSAERSKHECWSTVRCTIHTLRSTTSRWICNVWSTMGARIHDDVTTDATGRRPGKPFIFETIYIRMMI